jgi:hypothetical protein
MPALETLLILQAFQHELLFPSNLNFLMKLSNLLPNDFGLVTKLALYFLILFTCGATCMLRSCKRTERT